MSGEFKVGRFKLVGTTVTGPEDYMESGRYDQMMERIALGKCVTYTVAIDRGSPAELAVLTALQTDYASWSAELEYEHSVPIDEDRLLEHPTLGGLYADFLDRGPTE